jgi:hypothetical protein
VLAIAVGTVDLLRVAISGCCYVDITTFRVHWSALGPRFRVGPRQNLLGWAGITAHFESESVVTLARNMQEDAWETPY